MKLSTDHILTTHVGSLPRPPDLLAMLEAREAGHGFDEAAFEARIAIGEHSRICDAQRFAASSACPAGTISLTKPSSLPSAADTRRPVRIMPSACFCGIMRGSR